MIADSLRYVMPNESKENKYSSQIWNSKDIITAIPVHIPYMHMHFSATFEASNTNILGATAIHVCLMILHDNNLLDKKRTTMVTKLNL